MNQRTQRAVLVSLLALTAAFSVAAYLADPTEGFRPFDLWGGHAYSTYPHLLVPVPKHDLFVAAALAISALFVLRRRRTAILGVLIGIGGYSYWAFTGRRWLHGSPFFPWGVSNRFIPRLFTYFFNHFPNSNIWHVMVLTLLFPLLIWMIKQAVDDRPRARNALAGEDAGRVWARRTALVGTLAWAIAGAVFFDRHPVVGLAPQMTPVPPNVSFVEHRLVKVPLWDWYTTPLPNNPPTVAQVALRTLPNDLPSADSSVWIRPDGNEAAYIGHQPGVSRKQYAAIGSYRGPKFDQIKSITYSPNGDAVGYIAREGKRWFAVVGGKHGPDFEDVRSLIFSADGRRFAYKGLRDRKTYFVADGQIGPAFDSVYQPSFRCDGKWQYGAMRPDRQDVVLVEGEEPRNGSCETCGGVPDYVCPGRPQTSDAGIKKRIAFTWHLSWGEPRLDSEPSPVGIIGPEGAWTDKRLQAVFSGKRVTVFDGKKQIPASEISFISIEGYHTIDSELCWVNVNGEMVDGSGCGIDEFVSSRDGTIFAFITGKRLSDMTGYRFEVVVGRKPGPRFERIIHLQMSADGKTVAYCAIDKGRAFIMVNDHKGQEYDWVDAPVLSPDGTEVAYRAWQGSREFIVLNDREAERFNWVSDPVFSPDGKKLAYAASKGREIWWKVLDVR